MPADNWLRHKMMAAWLPSDRVINVTIVLGLVVALLSLIARLYAIGPQGLDCQVLRPFLTALGLIVLRHYVRSMRREVGPFTREGGTGKAKKVRGKRSGGAE